MRSSLNCNRFGTSDATWWPKRTTPTRAANSSCRRGQSASWLSQPHLRPPEHTGDAIRRQAEAGAAPAIATQPRKSRVARQPCLSVSESAHAASMTNIQCDFGTFSLSIRRERAGNKDHRQDPRQAGRRRLRLSRMDRPHVDSRLRCRASRSIGPQLIIIINNAIWSDGPIAMVRVLKIPNHCPTIRNSSLFSRTARPCFNMPAP